MATLHIYHVDEPTQAVPRPEPVKLESATIVAEGDTAKRAAKKMLEDQGYVVRSINWGPQAGQPDALIAYVNKKGDA
jgi:hypothetical protein